MSPGSVIGGVDVETEKSGKDSFCCGAGGAQMWMEEDADKRVNEIRGQRARRDWLRYSSRGLSFLLNHGQGWAGFSWSRDGSDGRRRAALGTDCGQGQRDSWPDLAELSIRIQVL